MQNFSFRGVLCPKEKSDVACWGVESAKGPLKRLYFKLPKLADDEVRMKVLHAGMCHSDCFKIDEEWVKGMTWPLVPGHEIIGQIEKVGSAVSNFKPGDKVAFGVFRDCCGKCKHCLKGDDQLCSGVKYKETYDPYLGGYSTHMQVKAGFTFHLPEKLDPKKAAPIMCAGATVFAPLKRWGTSGARCGVVGIGGLGHMAIQIANKMGMHVVAFSTSPNKEKEARSYGAKEFVVSTNEAEMRKIMTTEKLDLLINTAFVPEVSKYLYCISSGGCFIQVALQAHSQPTIIDHLNLVAGQKTFVGSAVGSRKEVQETLNFCAENNIAPVVENYKWSDLPKAYERLHQSKARYRCVVDIAESFNE